MRLADDDIPVDEESVMESETSSIPIVTPNHEEVTYLLVVVTFGVTPYTEFLAYNMVALVLTIKY